MSRYKPLSSGSIAVLLINASPSPADLTLPLSTVPGITSTTVTARDVWNHQDLGKFTTEFVAKQVPSHDSVFLVLDPTPALPAPSLHAE